MKVSPLKIKELQALYKAKFGTELPDDEAAILAQQLLLILCAQLTSGGADKTTA